jgi:hypothetical protein
MEDLVYDVETFKNLARRLPGHIDTMQDICITLGGKAFPFLEGP